MTRNRRHPLRLALAFALAWLALAEPASAQRRRQQGQLPQPNLQSVFPMGVKPGAAVEVVIRGSDLEGATTLWFDHPGLRAVHVKETTFRVECAEGTPYGHHDVRVVGTYGISNPRTIVVGDRPESLEAEPNNAPDQATPIALNAVVNGEVGAADLDHFAFEGKAGQRLRIDLEGERIDSRLDATLRLLDASGRELAESRDAVGLDPSLDVTLPADGRYVIKVHDVLYRGSVEYPYRLTLTDGPWIEAAFPAVLAPGESTTVTLYGQNLGGEVASDLRIDGRPVERKSVTIVAPAAAEPDPDYPTAGHVASAAAVRRGFEYVDVSAAGRSNPVFFALATDPVVPEQEPNDGEPAQDVAVPCDVVGRFDRPGDVDVYRFKATKGQVLWIEATAERIGSPADPAFVVQKVGEKGAVSDLVAGDDLPDKGAQARFNTATVDAAVRWTAPEDGTFQVAVNDLYSSQRGDVRLNYRLNIRPERPDFFLFVVPDNPNGPDALTIGAGGRGLAYAFAWRIDGFNGPILVEAAGLPEGVRCEPVVIPSDQSTAPIVFEAADSAPTAVGTVRLVGRSRFGDRKEDLREEDLRYVPGASRLGPDRARAALPGGAAWPGSQPNVAPARLTRGFAIKVVGPAPLALGAGPAVVQRTPGSLLNIDLTARRREGFAEAVAVSLVNPLPGTPNPPPTATIPKEADSGRFSYLLPKNLTPGFYTLVLQGTGPYPFSKDPNAKTKPNVTLTEPSAAVTLIVRPSPATVALGTKGGNLKAGEALDVEVTVTPKGPAPGPIEVALEAPDSLKLSADPVVAAPGRPATLRVKAAGDSPAGAVSGVAVKVTVPVGGAAVEVHEPLTLTIAK